MVFGTSNYCLYYNMILWSMQLLFIYNDLKLDSMTRKWYNIDNKYKKGGFDHEKNDCFDSCFFDFGFLCRM